MQKIKKLVIPAAGTGTRFLPATKAMPKEMLPIVDKPVIQYVVEEAVASGIEDIIIVTGWHKRSIEDHFDYPFELEKRLEEAGKHKELESVRKIAGMANFIYVRQKGPYGNGTPVLCAKKLIGNEPFAVLWGDEFMHAKVPRLKQCIQVFNKYRGPVIAGMQIKEKEKLEKYGIAKVKHLKDNVHQVLGIVEKPKPKKAPSDIALLGAYVLTPDIFPYLEKQSPGRAKEIWLVDAITALAKKRKIYTCVVKNAHYHDCGSKLEYLKAQISLGLEHPEIKGALKEYLKGLKIK